MKEKGIFGVCIYVCFIILFTMAIVPTLAICALVFVISGMFSLVCGFIKLLNDFSILPIPYADYIGIIGIENPVAVFVICVILGVVLCLLGHACWKMLHGFLGSFRRE